MKTGPARSSQRAKCPTPADAEDLAVEMLSFLAVNEDRLTRFLGETGFSPGDLRAETRSPGFAACLLDYLASHEPTFLAFAAETGRDPGTVDRLRHAIAASREAP